LPVLAFVFLFIMGINRFYLPCGWIYKITNDFTNPDKPVFLIHLNFEKS